MPEESNLFGELGVDVETDFDPAGLEAGQEVAFEPSDGSGPTIGTVDRAEETLIGPEVRTDDGSIFMATDFQGSETPPIAPVESRSNSLGLDPVGFERQNSNGRFAPENTRPDPSVPADRAPDGRFVSKDRSPVESFGRRDDGLFDLF